MTRLYLLALAVLMLAGAAACSDQAVVSSLNSEDLLAATLSPTDVRQLFPATETWWPDIPEFNAGFDPFPGERFYVVQNYSQVGGMRQGWLDQPLTLCENEITARKLYADRVKTDAKGCIKVSGPRVGDECAYFTGRDSDDYYGITMRYRVGEVVGRLSLFSKTGYAKPEFLAACGRRIASKVRVLLGGGLKAEPLSKWTAACLPSPPATDAIGPVVATGYVPAEGWALVDTAGDPHKVLDTLHKGGVNQLAVRRYRINGDADHVIDITLFRFDDRSSAESWVREWANEVQRIGSPLDAGKTGKHSAYGIGNGGRFYEMMFAKGSFVGDVCGQAPFADVKPLCEAPVRQLAEMWYELLPGE